MFWQHCQFRNSFSPKLGEIHLWILKRSKGSKNTSKSQDELRKINVMELSEFETWNQLRYHFFLSQIHRNFIAFIAMILKFSSLHRNEWKVQWFDKNSLEGVKKKFPKMLILAFEVTVLIIISLFFDFCPHTEKVVVTY